MKETRPNMKTQSSEKSPKNGKDGIPTAKEHLEKGDNKTENGAAIKRGNLSFYGYKLLYRQTYAKTDYFNENYL